MRSRFLVMGSLVLVVSSWAFFSERADASAPPAIVSVVEGHAPVSGNPTLLLSGHGLTGLKTYSLKRTSDQADMGTVTVIVKSGAAVVVELSAAVAADSAVDYSLHVTHKRGFADIPVTIQRASQDTSANDARYLQKAGGAMTGQVTSAIAGAGPINCVSATATSSDEETSAITGTAGTEGWGVTGIAPPTQPSGNYDVYAGVRGISSAQGNVGVYGDSRSAGGGTGVWGTAAGTFGRGIFAQCLSNSGNTIGVETFVNSGVGEGTFVFSSAAGAICYDAHLGDATTPLGNFLVCTDRVSGLKKARIDATGKGFFNGGTQASGADFAERVKVDRDAAGFEAGDVIAIDPTGTRRFKLSDGAASALVVGVYSTKPAMLAGLSDAMTDDWKKDEVPLAVVGIVPCKVCDEGGAIRAGDLLVSASVPGHAMKAPANPKPGTVLGKALAALDKGTGKIEVFLVSR